MTKDVNKSDNNWLHKVMTSCKKTSELVSLSQETPLTIKQKISLNTHVALCKSCRDYQKNSRLISKMIKEHKSHSDNITD